MQWYAQILKAVESEYNVRLVICPETVYENIDNGLKRFIEGFHKGISVDTPEKIILGCFEGIISKYDLRVSKDNTGGYGLSIELENERDFMSVYYGFHPYDYPYEFSVRYCKQSFIDKNFVLYRTDTKQITPLWMFDRNINIQLTGSYEEDAQVITECCKKAVEMFEYFQAMSNEEYYEASEELKHSNV